MEAFSGARTAAADISAEQLTPKRPTCLLSHSIPTKQACEMIVALTGLDITALYARVLHVIQNADTTAQVSLAALFGVTPGKSAPMCTKRPFHLRFLRYSQLFVVSSDSRAHASFTR